MKEFVKHLFLFRGLDEETVDRIFSESGWAACSFSRTEVIYSPEDYEKKIGFVISGRCEVRLTKPDGTSVVLNTLNRFDAFGVLAIFSEEDEFPTEIYAAKNSDILFFTKDEVLRLVRSYPEIAMNVISFLSSRIKFLNKEIATFSGTRVENRLASFLLGCYERQGEEFSFNCKKTSEAINAGRASVYRALDSLVSDGIIVYADKKIKIINPKGLKEITK